MRQTNIKATGWLRDLPDHRDYSINHNTVLAEKKKLGVAGSVKKLMGKTNLPSSEAALPSTVDLREHFSDVENQGSINSCTAQAGVGLMEYFEKRAFGKHIEASRLFLYKTTRNLMGDKRDKGAFLRTTMEAMVLFGVVPEKYWPYNVENVHDEPTAFCYSFAQNFQSVQYFTLDPSGADPKDTLVLIKKNLAAGFPSMFGFTVFQSIRQSHNGGKIPFPGKNEKSTGGHAVVAAGYDDNMVIENKQFGGKTRGAFIIRNSWGTHDRNGNEMGDNGYYFLPYEYVLRGLAVDWWTLVKAEWIDTGKFGL